MKEFPTKLELLEFFGVEPHLTDPEDTPWIYNRLVFSVELDKERVDCVIDNPELEVQWFREGVENAYFSFFPIHELSIQEYPGGTCLVAKVTGPDIDSVFRLQLRPRVHVSLKSSQ